MIGAVNKVQGLGPEHSSINGNGAEARKYLKKFTNGGVEVFNDYHAESRKDALAVLNIARDYALAEGK